MLGSCGGVAMAAMVRPRLLLPHFGLARRLIVDSYGFNGRVEGGGAKLGGCSSSFFRRSSAVSEDDDGLSGAYRRLVAGGKLQAGDLAQETVVSALDGLSRETADGKASSWLEGRFAIFSPLFKNFLKDTNDPVKGIYMYGGVGTGKTMLMDLFYNNAKVQKKRRMHFHAFMLEVHMRLHKLLDGEQDSGDESDEPIRIVAQQILDEARLLCLDEVEVTDIADALILRRLFAVLWPQGAVLVATSNRTPDELYRNGLNRHLFLPFINQLKEYCHVYSLDGGKDYRRGHSHLRQVYLLTTTDDVDEAIDKEFLALTGGYEGASESIPVMMGRYLNIVAAKGVARASFSYLCGGAFGAADYYAIAQNFRALVLDRIPWLGDPARENELRRFITLVDVLYESNLIFVCSADLPVDRLFEESPGSDTVTQHPRAPPIDSDKDEKVLQIVTEGGSSGRSTSMIGDMEWSGTGRPDASLASLQGTQSFTRFATARVVSRLMEMQSDAYILRGEEMASSGKRNSSNESRSVNQ